jgi:hypothetical protein
VKIQLILKIVFFVCAPIVFKSAAWSQERASTLASAEAKTKASGEEAEANTAEAYGRFAEGDTESGGEPDQRAATRKLQFWRESRLSVLNIRKTGT